jgi:membrane protein implicated in regulation of membrane protease activity
MHVILSIIGIVIVIAALCKLSRIFTVSGIGVIIIFGLGILLVRFWPLFLAGVALALSLFLWWLVIRFLIEKIQNRRKAPALILPPPSRSWRGERILVPVGRTRRSRTYRSVSK